MISLQSRHTHAFSMALLRLYAPGTLATLPERLFEVMQLVAPGHLMHISVTKPGTGTVDAFLNLPAHAELMALAERQAELLTMPGVRDSSFYLAAERGPTSFHDLMSQRELERTVLWESFCRPLDLRHDLSVNFHCTDDLFYTLSSSRDTRAYSDEERELVRLLQPHLRQRFQQLLAAEPGHPLGRPASTSKDVAWLLCDDAGRILDVSASALRMLELAGLRVGTFLPADLSDWLGQYLAEQTLGSAPPSPLLRPLRGGSLVVHALLNRHSHQHRLILQVAHTSSVPLTRREAEVADWLAEGKANAEIATILGISRATVKIHVERILTKLGVENRTAAANVYRASKS